MDDGLSVAESFSEAICNSQFVQETLQKSGFIVNCEKSVWELQEVMTWLGITLDLTAKIFGISNTRIESILNKLNNLTSTHYVTATKVAQMICKIISTTFVLGNIVRLKTKYLYKSILVQTSWDSRFNVLYYHFALEEITLWKQNIKTLNKRPLIPYKLPSTKVYSDAGNSGIGTYFVIKDKYLIQKKFVAQKNVEFPHDENWKQYIAPCASFQNF